MQSNKAKPLVAEVPNLWAVESVDSVKLADLLNKAAAATKERTERLRVFIQVNTSDESQKGGVPCDGKSAAALAAHIIGNCPALQLVGLMTIGKLGDVSSVYFRRLAAERETVGAAIGKTPEDLELSMGMSGDFAMAIAEGSTSVRVGSAIFGEREYKGSVPAKRQDAGGEGAAPPSSSSSAH